MTTLPIVDRELRTASRRRGTYWLRTVMAAFGLLACLQWFVGGITATNPAAIGLGAFRMLALLGLVMAMGAPIVTADCISSERREGTLGLLFLTALKSRDVVLGKFAVTGLVALYALLGFAPVLMLPLMIGGVTAGEVVRMAFVLVNLLFLSLAVGMFVSVRARTRHGAILGAFALLAAIAFGPMMLQGLTFSRLTLAFGTFSPLTAYFSALDAAYVPAPLSFWTSLVIGHGLGWLLVVLATFTLHHNWQAVFTVRAANAAATRPRRLVAPARVVMWHRENSKRAFAPVARALLRMPGQRAMAWFAAFISLLGSVWNGFVMHQLGSVWAAASVSQVFSLASSALFAFVAGRFLFESRRSGELELLLVTPVGARGILREQRLALLRLLIGPLYLVLFGAVLAAVGSLYIFGSSHALMALIFGFSNMLSSVLGVLAVCRVAMWFGMRANSFFALVGGTVGLVMLVPTVLVYLVAMFSFSLSANATFLSLLAAPLLLLKNVFFLVWAAGKLKQEFRTSERSLFDRVWRWMKTSATARLPEPGTGTQAQSAQ